MMTDVLRGDGVTLANSRSRKASEIKIGDEVLGWDKQTMTFLPTKITQVHSHSEGIIITGRDGRQTVLGESQRVLDSNVECMSAWDLRPG